MSADATPDPFDVSLSFGERLQLLRTGRGMTRKVLGGLVGKSASWVKAVETGRLDTPKLSILLRLAEALRISDLAQLTGSQSISVETFTGPGHERLPAVREAINRLPVLNERSAPPLGHVRARLDQAWAARHKAANHRQLLGRLLPGLISDAQLAAHQAKEPSQRRAAQAVLAEVYALAQFFIAYQPAADLLWRVAERGMVAAQDSGDPHAIGIASWLLAQAHRDAGEWEAADMVTTQTTRILQPYIANAQDNLLAIWGALLFETGYTAARRGESGTAWRMWDLAHETAHRLPSRYYHPVTSFSQAIMGAHAVTIAVELRNGGEGVRQAANAPAEALPSRPRRARHRIEQARAYHLDGQPESALHVLDSAHHTAPETIRYNGYARAIILEELQSAPASRHEQVRVLAEKVGLLT